MNNIYWKLSQITAEISAVAKNLKVGEGRNAYKAVGEADVLAAVKPIEAKYGVYSYPYSRDIAESAILETIGYDGKVRKQQFVRIVTVYRFVNIENPDEYIDITTYGDGVDSQDKSVGKAMTYGDKYALLKAYKIITGEDPDQYASEDLAKKEKKAPSPKKTETAKATTAEERAKAAYPSREQMVKDVLVGYDTENQMKILKFYKVDQISKLNDAQLMTVWGRKYGTAS